MDLLNKFVNQAQGQQQPAETQQQPGNQNNAANVNAPTEQKQGGFLSGLGDKFNNAAGGGAAGEAQEDHLDKAIDMVQEKFLKQGPQDNESAAEQAKDKAIAGFIRDQYKSATGKEFPVAEKKSS